MQAKAQVAFKWNINGWGYGDEVLHKMRCDKAFTQSIPFPGRWKTSINVLTKLPAVLQTARTNAAKEINNDTVDCELLGIPKPSPELDDLCSVEAAMTKNASATRQAKGPLLAAHLGDDVWLCHPGTFTEDGSLANNPFALEDLVTKTVRTEEAASNNDDHDTSDGEDLSPGAPKAMDLLAIAASNPTAWTRARAYALWKAEEMRAERGVAGFRDAIARRGFEENPFRWELTGRSWLSHVDLAFLWSWTQKNGARRREMVFVRANDVFTESNRSIPRPEAFKGPWEIWRERLEEAAAKQPLCKYLGHQTNSGGYEANPEKWRVPQGQDKSHSLVWYEWLHVARGKDKLPHRVAIRASNILHHSRDVPHHPLHHSCPRELHFSLEYMQAFVAWKTKDSDSEYVGLSFEGDRPAFQYELPDGGMDIQEHPVYWHLPSGLQCESLMDLNAMQEKDVKLNAPENHDEAYDAIGEQMFWHVLGVCEDERSLEEYHVRGQKI